MAALGLQHEGWSKARAGGGSVEANILAMPGGADADALIIAATLMLQL